MERKEIIKYIKNNKPAYRKVNFSWHSDSELKETLTNVQSEQKPSQPVTGSEEIRPKLKA